jgi:hypothetical protein
MSNISKYTYHYILIISGMFSLYTYPGIADMYYLLSVYCPFEGHEEDDSSHSNPHPPTLSLFWQSKKILTTPHLDVGWSRLREMMVGVGE